MDKRYTRPLEKMVGKSAPLKYSPSPTRATSLHSFMGDAAGDEIPPTPFLVSGEMKENLECQFQSGACRTDLPSAWGPPNVDKRLAGKFLSLPSEMFSWIRNKGETRRVK